MSPRRPMLAVLAALLLTTTGCSAATAPASSAPADAPSASAPAPAPKQLDLTGSWSWKDAPDPSKTMTATITADRIEIHWPSTDGSNPLYWAGSFTPPKPGEDAYTFTSNGDTAAMQKSLLASSDATKKFSFANDAISFDITVQGTTKTLKLTRD